MSRPVVTRTRAAEEEIVPLPEQHPPLHFRIERVAHFVELQRHLARGPVVVRLHLKVGIRRVAPDPPAQHVAAGHVGVVAIEQAFGAAIRIALQGPADRRLIARVDAEPAATELQLVIGRLTGREHVGVPAPVFAEHAITAGRAEPPAMAGRGDEPLFAADCQKRRISTRRRGVLRDDVDDAVDGVGTPECAAGAANDFNTIDVGEKSVLHIPEGAGEQWRVRSYGRRA